MLRDSCIESHPEAKMGRAEKLKLADTSRQKAYKLRYNSQPWPYSSRPRLAATLNA